MNKGPYVSRQKLATLAQHSGYIVHRTYYICEYVPIEPTGTEWKEKGWYRLSAICTLPPPTPSISAIYPPPPICTLPPPLPSISVIYPSPPPL